MVSATTFLILGGDARMRACAKGFSALGYPAQDLTDGALPEAQLASALRAARVLVLPVPLLQGNRIAGTALPLDSVLRLLPDETAAYAGRVPAPLRARITDYSQMDAFQTANAVPTAEGAIAILMEALPVTLSGAEVLVLGFGRCGRALATRLDALGTRVTVTARRPEDLHAIEDLGLTSMRTGSYQALERYHCIVNTVPAMVFPEDAVAQTAPDAFLLDLASAPGGMDFDASRRLGRRFRHALALPGKVAPTTSGLIIRDTILEHLNLH